MIAIIIALLLLCSNAVFAQINNPEFEFVYDHQDPYTFTKIERSYELGSGDLILSGISFILPYIPNGTPGVPILLKMSSSGETLVTKEYQHENYRAESSSILINTESNGLILMGCKDPLNTNNRSNNQGLIYFYTIDDDLNVISSLEHNIEIDTTEDEIPTPYSHLKMFSAFEADGGIWACIYKRVSATQGKAGNDSIYFCRFDYEGNWVDTKYMELFSYGNQYAFKSPTIVMETETGYDLFLSELNGKQKNRQMVVQKYDRDFNFISEIERPNNKPDIYEQLSLKKLSSGNVVVSSYYYDFSKFTYRVALTEFDDKLNVHNQVKYDCTGGVGFLIIPADISGVDFIDENRIFFAYVDHEDFSAYFSVDNWIYIKMLTRDLEEEKELYYDYKGENSYFVMNSIKATNDGGLLLCGLFCDIVNTQDKKQGFAVKFPPEAFLSIEDAHANGLKTAIAYPNPGNNTLNIRTSLKDAVVEVYDIQGRMVYNRDITENITSVSTESWNSGMYLWRVVREGKECESGKWVKD